MSPAQGNFHNVTPCTFAGAGGVWKQGFGSVDKEAVELGAAAGIDLQVGVLCWVRFVRQEVGASAGAGLWERWQ